MKNSIGVLAMLFSAMSFAAPTRVTLELRDGSRLIGTTSMTSFKAVLAGQKNATPFAVDQLHGFTLADDGTSARLATLTHAAPLDIAVPAEKFEITGSFGKLQIPMSIIHSAELGEPEPVNASAREALTFKCSELLSAETPTETSGGSLHVVTLRFAHGPNLLLTSVGRSAADKETLLSMVKTVQACKAPNLVHVSTAKFFAAVDTVAGTFKGWSTPVGNVTVGR